MPARGGGGRGESRRGRADGAGGAGRPHLPGGTGDAAARPGVAGDAEAEREAEAPGVLQVASGQQGRRTLNPSSVSGYTR